MTICGGRGRGIFRKAGLGMRGEEERR